MGLSHESLDPISKDGYSPGIQRSAGRYRPDPGFLDRVARREVRHPLLVKAAAADKVYAIAPRGLLEVHRLQDDEVTEHDRIEHHAETERQRRRRWNTVLLQEDGLLSEFFDFLVPEHRSAPDRQAESLGEGHRQGGKRSTRPGEAPL